MADIDFGTSGFDDVAPDASSMVESMRAHGYTLPTAIADLIDNSIAARSRNIWLHFEWAGQGSWISIVDDGRGMDEQELVDAMRLGSQSPRKQRDPDDLGRFGLGMKTASFSQARRLTVITRPASGGGPFVRRWDLDHLAKPEVKGWQLLRSANPESGKATTLLDDMKLHSGTQVLLEVLDRVIGVSPGREQHKEDHFLWQVENVRTHLSMVFHRFLARSRDSLAIHINGEPIRPWDPFLEEHKATQTLGTYAQRLGRHPKPVRVKAFVMPHRDRFASNDEHRAAGGPGGWNAQQGFYLFRGNRLIIAGDWLDLGWQKEEHFKLARISLDIPNSMDHEWQIDVKKSSAAPPAVLRDWLRGIAQHTRKRAKEVYAHRGKYGPRKKRAEHKPQPLWVMARSFGGEFSYRIDRKHPVLSPLIRSLSNNGKQELEAVLRLIEETVPVQRIWIDIAENQDGAARPFGAETSESLRHLILLCHQSMIRVNSISSEQAWERLLAFEGFQGLEAQAIMAQLREEE